jgi:DNA excision repair protein ERCC-4
VKGRGKGRGGGRGRGRGRKTAAVEVKASEMNDQEKEEIHKAGTVKESELANVMHAKGLLDSNGPAQESVHDSNKIVQNDSSLAETAQRPGEDCNAQEINVAKPIPPAYYYALESDQRILDVVKPLFIIVYDPDMAFVREIEVYKAENPVKPLKVYFIFHENSTEVQKFEASIRRENSAFESLIRQKSLMMIPVDQVRFQLK